MTERDQAKWQARLAHRRRRIREELFRLCHDSNGMYVFEGGSSAKLIHKTVDGKDVEAVQLFDESGQMVMEVD